MVIRVDTDYPSTFHHPSLRNLVNRFKIKVVQTIMVLMPTFNDDNVQGNIFNHELSQDFLVLQNF